jgi:4-hydroxy-tetrahydrodipicolinate synthase
VILPPKQTSAPFGRLVTAMVTPFAADGSLDLAAARSLARYLVEHGSEGIVTAGTTGESPTLSDHEKLDLLSAVLEEVGDRASVVANVGTYDTAHSAHLARDAARAGAHGLLVVTPYYNKPPIDGIVAHTAAIAAAGDGVPVIYYNIPQRCIVNVDPTGIERLRDEAGIVGVKQATTDLAEARAIVAAGLALYAGNDDLLAPFLELGGVGGIHVASHLIGSEMLQLCELAAARDFDAMWALEAQLAPVWEALSIATNPIPLKAALELAGHAVGGVRLPLVAATGEQRSVLRGMLEQRGLLVTA